MKRVLFSIALLLSISFVFAQKKAVKEAKSISEEAKPDFNKAQQLIKDAFDNEETKNDPNTWNVAGLIQKRISEEENKKAYLKQKLDTAKMYNSLYDMFQYFVKCDEMEQVPDEKGKVKFKFRKNNTAIMVTERGNIVNAGILYFNEGKSKEALKFFSTYVDMTTNPMFEKEEIIKQDTLLSEIAFYATWAAFRTENYSLVKKYAPIACTSKEKGQYALEFLASSYKAENDTLNWVESLKKGTTQYPEYPFFFGNLIDYYNNTGKYENAINFAEEMIAKSPTNPYFHYVKGYLNQVQKKYDVAIASFAKAIKLNPEYAEAYSNSGVSNAMIAFDINEKITAAPTAEQTQTMKTYYLEAQRNFEKARELKPDDKSLWLNGLHTVYYKLDSPKFEEIDKMLTGN